MNSKTILDVVPIDFQWPTTDPFLFCAFHNDAFPQGRPDLSPDASLEGRNIGQDFEIRDGWRMYHGDRIPGFPVHPHRGFETVTIVQKGLVDHSDSMGAAGRYGEGDVQWMTAGKGVQHSEMFPMVNQDKPNPLLLFQVWINLPAKNKMVAPHFSMFWADKIPRYINKDESGNRIVVDVIAGQLGDQVALSPPPDSWAGDPENHVAIWTIVLDAGAKWVLPAAEAGLNRSLYYYQGASLDIDGTDVAPLHKIDLNSEAEVVLQNGDKESRLLMLQGRPIKEPVVQYGPFVMNTKAEIQQTFSDYQSTHFGGWPWPEPDHVHANRGRFARHADGRLEEAE